MWKTVLRRILVMIPQIFILSLLIFFLAKLMPGDALSGEVDGTKSPEQIEALRQKLGWNDPWYVQYWNWISKAFQGDLGISFQAKKPVVTLIMERLDNTIFLSILSLILTYSIAIPLGMIAGRYNNTWKDKIIVLYNYLLYSLPSFVLALLFLWLFGFTLGWVPTRGSLDSGLETAPFLTQFFNKLYHLILPAFILAFGATVGTIQYLRSGIIDAKTRDYVRTARAKGVPTNKVYSQHIFRNSILPIASFLGFEITGVLGGSIFIEQIFSIPGTGQLFVTSIIGRDYSLMVALLLMFGLTSLLGSLLSDIIMSIVDPRIRIQ